MRTRKEIENQIELYGLRADTAFLFQIEILLDIRDLLMPPERWTGIDWNALTQEQSDVVLKEAGL